MSQVRVPGAILGQLASQGSRPVRGQGVGWPHALTIPQEEDDIFGGCLDGLQLLSHIEGLGCLAVPEGGVLLLDCPRGEWRSGQPGAAPVSRGHRELPGYLG